MKSIVKWLGIFALVLVTGLPVTACENNPFNKLSGIYISDGDSLLESIEFEKDGTCYTVDSIVGLRQAMQYEVKGDKVIMIAGGASQPCFRIIDSNTIEGIAFGFNGTYKKK